MTAHDESNPQDVPDYEAYLWHLREPQEPAIIVVSDDAEYEAAQMLDPVLDWPSAMEWDNYLDERDRYL